jgi:predicted permease
MDVHRWLYTVPLRVRALLRRDRLDADLDEEIRYHLDRQIETNVARGMTPTEARAAALRAFGGVTQQVERCRDTRKVRVFQDLLQDLRYGTRSLRLTPAFTVAAVVTLALGIGASVAVFTVVNGVLLRPLPFPEPDRLFLVTHAPRGILLVQPSLSDRDYLAFRGSDRLFEHLATFSNAGASLTGAGDPVMVRTAGVTTEFFDVLRVFPATGRAFGAGDDQPGRDNIAILSDALWRSRFHADPAIAGKAIVLDGTPRTIAGVMPAAFGFPHDAEVWTPKEIRFDPHQTMMAPVIGRLKPGVTREQARAELDAVLPPVTDAEADGSWASEVLPLKDLIVGDIRRPLEILAGAVLFVLLIACVNVANLLIARASSRDREMAMRAALGASRARIARQLLTESMLLGVAGGVCGVLLATWLVPALLALAPAGRIPRLESIRLDGSVLGFALAVSILTALLFGLVPALRITRSRLSHSLLPGGRAASGGRERLRGGLVIAEIALSLVLLTAAGLMLRSFLRLRGVDPGFTPGNVVTLTVDMPASSYPTPERLRAFHRALIARLAALPDVAAAGIVNWCPLGTANIFGTFQTERPGAPDGLMPDKPAVSAGYFAAMGIRLVQGRAFDDRDDGAAPGVAIVSRSVARIFEAESPIGKRVALSDNPAPEDWLTVVGVVDDVRQGGPGQPAHAAIYRPYLQVKHPFFLRRMTFAVRARSDARPLASAIRAVLREVDPNQPPTSIAMMEDLVAGATADPGFQTRLLGTFALLALMLAVLGTYGVLAYSVAQRTHEIGLRIALGAGRGAVMWMVIGRTLLLSGAAVALGTFGALAATRALASSLFEIRPADPLTFAAVAVIIVAAALAAGWVPARRATRVDPMVALRHD